MSVEHPNLELIALGIRQPWAELILRGVKTVEVRTLPTNVRGPIYLYSSQKTAQIPAAVTAAEQHEIDVASLPKGRLVGTVDIVGSRPCVEADEAAACVPFEMMQGKQGWRLARPQRLEEPLKVRFLPYGVWFYPFRRRNCP